MIHSKDAFYYRVCKKNMRVPQINVSTWLDVKYFLLGDIFLNISNKH